MAAITGQRTKFNLVVSELNHQQVVEVEDIITSPTEQEPYDRLKAELVRRLSTSREQRVRQLLSHEETGDRKTSQFVRHFKGLAPDVPDDFLRAMQASRLPSHVQAIFTGQTEGSLDSASHPDTICEVTPSLPQRAFRLRRPTTAGLIDRIEELSRQVASLRSSQTQPRTVPRTPSLATQRLPQHPRLLSNTPGHLLVPLAFRGRSPKMLPTVHPPAEELPPAEGLPPAERLPPAEGLPPADSASRKTPADLNGG